MKFLFCSIFICCFLGVFGVPVADTKNDVTVTEYEYTPQPNGEYTFSYATSDGQRRSETGTLATVGEEGVQVIVVSGSFSWIDSEGKEFSYTYVADENGYRTMDPNLFLPVNPPEEIQSNALLSLVG